MNNEMPKRMAVFRHLRHEFNAVFQNHGDDDDWCVDEYMRISEWQTVEFKPLSQADVAGAQLTALSKLREQTVAEFSEKLGAIDERMANLRALTGPDDAPIDGNPKVAP